MGSSGEGHHHDNARKLLAPGSQRMENPKIIVLLYSTSTIHQYLVDNQPSSTKLLEPRINNQGQIL